MSRIDILPQPASRPVDPSSARNPSTSPDGQQGNGNSAAQGFDALLEGFSGNLSREGRISQRDPTLMGEEPNGATIDGAPDVGDPLQALLSNAMPDSMLGGAAGFQAASAGASFLEGLLPRILDRASQGSQASDGRSGPSSGSPNLLLPQQGSGEIDLANPGLGARLPIAVQKQETHFRPIVEGIDLPSNPETVDPTVPGQVASNVPIRPFNAIGTGAPRQNDRMIPAQTASDNSAGTAMVNAADQGEDVRKFDLGIRSDRSDVQGPSPAGGAKAEGASLPPATLQQIAGAIIDDVETFSASQPSFVPADGPNRVAAAKASAGALRVLHLQLKPAELGLVTIKMRLAGDGIEMELQAESEETAELLRNDAEKLSSLLRVSGYRPDSIIIHSTEAAAHDRSSFQRSQQGSHSQGSSSEQGAASGQGDSSRHRQDQQERGGQDARKGSDQARAHGSSGSGGVYL